MADVVDTLNFSLLHLGVATLVLAFSVFVYYKYIHRQGSGEDPTKRSQKKSKKSERMPTQLTPKAPKSPIKPQPQPQKVTPPKRSPKSKENDAPKEQVLATTDEEDWVKVKSAKPPRTQAPKPVKTQKQDNQPQKNRQQNRKADKSSKKGEKVEHKNSSDSSPAPSHSIPAPLEKSTNDEWQDTTSKKKKKLRSRKE